MRKLFGLMLPFLLFGCNQASRLKAERLRDTIEAIRRLYDYKPLVQADAYDFINKYYLPRLDTLRTKRKLYLFAMAGVNFRSTADYRITEIEKVYSGDTINKFHIPPPLPPSLNTGKIFKWDYKKLSGTTIIADQPSKGISGDINAFRRLYGYGYMCISYPQYNAFTKCIVIREWEENGDSCGTGRERTFSFIKIQGGWKLDH